MLTHQITLWPCSLPVWTELLSHLKLSSSLICGLILFTDKYLFIHLNKRPLCVSNFELRGEREESVNRYCIPITSSLFACSHKLKCTTGTFMKYTPEQRQEIEINYNRKVCRIASHFIFHNVTRPNFADPIFENREDLFNRVLSKLHEYTGE